MPSINQTQDIRQHSEAERDGLNRLRILYLRRLHGLTEAQAQAIAALVWGAM